MMNSDLNFMVRMVRKIDKMDNYLAYLGNDYLPKFAKDVRRGFKSNRRGFFWCTVGFAGVVAYIYQNDKRINEMQDRLTALEERLDKVQFGNDPMVLDEDDDVLK